jgi:transcriptional regulator with XRE-family HTH domain
LKPMIRLTEVEKAALAARLAAARRVRKLTQKQVAKAMSVTALAVQKWEQGSVPSEGIRPKLAKLYGLPEMKLFAEVERHLAADRALVESPA